METILLGFGNRDRALNQAGQRRSIASVAARDRAEPKGNQLIYGADFDDFAWSAADRQSDGTAANAAVFDQILLALRSIDFQGKGFAAMWTGNIGWYRQLHL